MSTFGKTDIGAKTWGYTGYVYTSGPYIVTEAVTITRILFYSDAAGNARVAIYQGTEEVAISPIVESASENCEAGKWHEYDVSATLLLPGTIVWFAHQQKTPAQTPEIRMARADSPVVGKASDYQAWTYGPFPNPFVKLDRGGQVETSIYATGAVLPTHILSINSTPISGISFLIGSTSKVTPFTDSLEEGSYTIEMPQRIIVGEETYDFAQWEDGSTIPSRTINLLFDMILTATYQLIVTPKGTLEVHAYEDSAEVTASVQIVGVGVYDTPLSINLPVRDYTLTTSYGAYLPQTKVATIVEAQTTVVVFNFVVTPPPPAGSFASSSQLRYTYFGSESMVATGWDLIASTIKSYGMAPVIQKALYGDHTPTELKIIRGGQDFIKMAIDALHAEGIKYHISMAITYSSFPTNMLQVNASGALVSSWGCASNPYLRAQIKNVVEDLASKYEIDGFSYDYVRYDGVDRCYCDYCRAEFATYLGETVTQVDFRTGGKFAPDGARYKEFMAWRPNAISELVGLMRQWMTAIRQQYYPELPPLEFTATTFMNTVGNLWWIGQDAINWIREGYIDVLLPMYYHDAGNVPTILSWLEQTKKLLGMPEGIIPASPLLQHAGKAKTPSDVAQEVNAIMQNGADGWSSWAYGGPGDNSGWPDIRPYWDLISRPPVFSLSNIAVTSLTDSATITWATDLLATSKVEYNTSPLFVARKIPAPSPDYPYANLDYWDIDHVPGVIVEETTPKTSHSITLTGLTSGTQYYMRVQSQDPSGIATSKVYIFTTTGVAPTYNLLISAGIGGTTAPQPGSYPIPQGQTQQVTAIPNTVENYRFLNWLLDGAVRTENPISVLMDADHTLQAIFEYVSPLPLKATLQGIVKDSKTNAPVVGATVTADGYADVTKIDGSYELVDIPAQQYTVTVTKEGYQTQTIPVDASAGGTFTADIPLVATLPPTPIPLAILVGGIILYLITKR